jgi:hypothetical protein
MLADTSVCWTVTRRKLGLVIRNFTSYELKVESWGCHEVAMCTLKDSCRWPSATESEVFHPILKNWTPDP